MGVRGFPTLFFVHDSTTSEMVYGARSYQYFEEAVLKLYPEAKKTPYNTSLDALFQRYPTLTTREYSELALIEGSTAYEVLESQCLRGKMHKTTTKNGSLYWAPK
ncbi:MAG: putative protein-disulfide isomerase [Bacteroidia bacterium]|jgi:putative protein-disulfide isomerase